VSILFASFASFAVQGSKSKYFSHQKITRRQFAAIKLKKNASEGLFKKIP
jgi:hypothetical protein